MTVKPAPHGGILAALAKNPKLPPQDRAQVEATLERYASWKSDLQGLKSTGTKFLADMVGATNNYKKWVDFDLVFKSKDDFYIDKQANSS